MTIKANASGYVTGSSIRNGVKIWKFQNNTSAVDVTHILNSYKEKEKGDSKELVYKGRICFSVTSGGNFLKAYLPKSDAKALFTMIENGSFSKHYPNGYEKFGGSVKEGKVVAVKLEINVFIKEEEKYNSKTRQKEKVKVAKVDLNIQEMPGERTQTGGYKPIGRATKQVKTIFNASDLLSMAVETMDFIRAAEAKALAEGWPLNTLTRYDYEKLPEIGVQPSLNATPQVAQGNIYKTAEQLEKMEGKEFYKEYLMLEQEMKKYKDELDRRVALKNAAEATTTE